MHGMNRVSLVFSIKKWRRAINQCRVIKRLIVGVCRGHTLVECNNKTVVNDVKEDKSKKSVYIRVRT